MIRPPPPTPSIATTSNRHGRFGQPVARQVVDAPSTRSLPLLARRHRLGRGPELRGRPRLDLDEHDRLAVARHDVDFAMPRAVAARKNCVPAALELGDGAIFAGFSELLALRRSCCRQQRQGCRHDRVSRRPAPIVDSRRCSGGPAEAGRYEPELTFGSSASSSTPQHAVRLLRRRRPSGGARRIAFRPAPRISTPRRNIAWTSALRSSTARSFVFAIADQLDADHQARAADVADDRVLLLQRAEAVHQVLADGRGVRDAAAPSAA